MDFSLSHEQEMLRDSARRFAQQELPAVARQLEERNEPAPRALVKRYAELGFLGVNIEESLGGLGLSNLDAVLVLEEFAKVSPAAAFPVFESCFGPVLAIKHFAPAELARRVVPRVCAGELIVAVSMSEPEAGSALTDLRTRGVVAGDSVILNGQKRWCSGAGHADGYLVYCRLGDAPGAKGIGAVYVEKGMEGLSFGLPEQLMGFRGIPSADLFLDNVRVPLANVVVPAGGFRKLMEAFDLERCGNSTMCLAIGQAAFDQALTYVQERHQFGKALIEFQAVQLKIAEMAMRLESSRLLIYRAVCNASAGLPSVKESSLAKCVANEMVREVCGTALQLMGGYGYNKSFPMEQRLRDGWGWGIAGGAIDIQKTNIAAAYANRRFDQRR